MFQASLLGCAQGKDVNAGPAQSKVELLATHLANKEIGQLEIIQLSPSVLTRTSVTQELLETGFDYKFVIHDMRAGAYRDGAVQAVRSVETQSDSNLADLRWAVIFYDTNDARVGAVYFDKTGRHGAVDKIPVAFKGNFFKWLDANFSSSFR